MNTSLRTESKKMKKLIICNNVYQILVALWIVHTSDRSESWDAIVSDHMNNSERVAQRMRECSLFENVYHVRTLALIKNQVSHDVITRIVNAVFPMRELREYGDISPVYSDVYFANFDNFSQVLYNALIHKNSDLKLHVFEEGLASYSSFARYYTELNGYYGERNSGIRKYLHKYVYRTRLIPGNLSEFLAFNPQLIQWDPECRIREMEKIDCQDLAFRKIVNGVFSFDPSVQEYDKKYIFFEESFFAEGSEVNDVELIEQLAQRVGKENMMVKIHPRNPVNRFKQRGYKTNRNTAIPWEVVVMNADDISDKILVTVASSCILNPIIVFGKNVRAYSLYDCIDHIPPILQGGYWDLVEKVYQQYPSMISRCKSIEEIT